MSDKLWLNYAIYGAFVALFLGLLIYEKAWQEPFIFAFLIIIIVGTLFVIPHETKMRQLIKVDRRAGLEKRIAQKKYEYLYAAIALSISVTLYLYYKMNGENSTPLLVMTVSIIGTLIGINMKHIADKEELKNMKDKKNL